MKAKPKSKPKYYVISGDEYVSDYSSLAEVRAAKKRLMLYASPKNKDAIRAGLLWIIKGRTLARRRK